MKKSYEAHPVLELVMVGLSAFRYYSELLETATYPPATNPAHLMYYVFYKKWVLREKVRLPQTRCPCRSVPPLTDNPVTCGSFRTLGIFSTEIQLSLSVTSVS